MAIRNGFLFRCTQGGISGSTEPDWLHTGTGQTVADGTCIWKNMGSCFVIYNDGTGIDDLRPGEKGSDVTGSHTSQNTSNVGGLTSGDVVTGVSTANSALITANGKARVFNGIPAVGPVSAGDLAVVQGKYIYQSNGNVAAGGSTASLTWANAATVGSTAGTNLLAADGVTVLGNGDIITSQGTAADTSQVNGVASSSVSPIANLMPAEAGADTTASHQSATTLSLSNQVISDNLVQNPIFANGGTGWSFPSSFHVTSEPNAPIGKNALYGPALTAAAIIEGTIQIPVDKAKTYLIEAWFYSSGEVTVNYAGFHEYDASGNAVNHVPNGDNGAYCLLNAENLVSPYTYHSAEVSGDGGTTNPSPTQFNSNAHTIVPYIILNDTGVSVGGMEVVMFRISEVAAGARRGLQSTTTGAGNYKAYINANDTTADGHLGLTPYTATGTLQGTLYVGSNLHDGDTVTFPTPQNNKPIVVPNYGGMTFDSTIGTAAAPVSQYLVFGATPAKNAANQYTGFTAVIKIASNSGASSAKSAAFSGLTATISIDSGYTLVQDTLSVSGTVYISGTSRTEPKRVDIDINDNTHGGQIGSTSITATTDGSYPFVVSCDTASITSGTVIGITAGDFSLTSATAAYSEYQAGTINTATPTGVAGINYSVFPTL